MAQKTYRGGEGRNAAPHSVDRPGPDRPREPARPTQGIERTQRGEDQPTDKARARQVHEGPQDASEGESEGEKAQREAAEREPQGPGEPAGHE